MENLHENKELRFDDKNYLKKFSNFVLFIATRNKKKMKCDFLMCTGKNEDCKFFFTK